MPIRTVLTYWDSTPRAEERLAGAFDWARRFDAHLSVATIGWEPDMSAHAHTAVAELPYLEKLHARAEEQASALAKQATERLIREGIRGEAFPLVTSPGGFAQRFGRHARFTDLVVLARPEDTHYAHGSEQAFEGALFDGEAAILVCIAGSSLEASRVMIAWDGKPAALHAVRRAEPFLTGAQEVEIVLIDASSEHARSADDLALMLSRRDLSTSIARLSSGGESAAQALKRRQVESGADFTVMGAYGRSRFRELVLGGVTRDFPAITATPVLMAH